MVAIGHMATVLGSAVLELGQRHQMNIKHTQSEKKRCMKEPL